MNKNLRGKHVGKTTSEKQFYSKVINNSDKFIDKTENLGDNLGKTDFSDFKNDGGEKSAIKKKSIKNSFFDFFNKNWMGALLIGILISMIAWLFSLYSSVNRELGEMSRDVDFFKKDLNSISLKYDGNVSDINDLKIFKAEVNKDIEYLKSEFDKIVK